MSETEWRAVITAAYRACGAQRPQAALWAFAFEFLVWWHEAGRVFYGKGVGDGGIAPSGATFQRDDGLIDVAADAVRVLGGWRVARALLKATAQRRPFGMPERRVLPDVRAIYLRGEDEWPGSG